MDKEMKLLQKIYAHITGKVLYKEVTSVKHKGKVYKLMSTAVSGRLGNYRTTYIVRADGKYLELEVDEIEEFISTEQWAERKRMIAALSKATFNTKHLKVYRGGKK